MISLHDDDENNNDPIDTTAYVVCNMILLVMGAGGNLLLITSVLVVKKLRTIDNAFIFNLVVSDSFALILQDVLGVIGILADDEENPLANESRLCKVLSFFCLSACICSVWSITACALYIYMRVCHKALFAVCFTPQIVTVMIFWLLALSPMIVLPSMMGWGSHVFDTRLMHCAYDARSSASFTYFMLTLGAWVPLTITIYCLIRAVLVLYNQNSQTDQEHIPEPPPIPEIHIVSIGHIGETSNPAPLTPQPNITLHNNVNTTRSVMCVAFYITIAWVAMSVVWVVGQWKAFDNGQFIFGMVLAHSPCCLNGIIYALTNEDFREAYKDMLTFWRRCGKKGGEVDKQEEGSQMEDNLEGTYVKLLDLLTTGRLKHFHSVKPRALPLEPPPQDT